MRNMNTGGRRALLIGCLAFGWTACDTFLEPDPASFTSTGNYYRQPAHFDAALNSAYSRLRAQAGIGSGDFRWLTEMRMDAINRHFDVNLPSVSGQPIMEWFYTEANPIPHSQWSDIYHTIAQTNIILQRIQNVDFPNQVHKDGIVGQAKFIRALSYWFAVQYWGTADGLGVPLILEEVRSPADAVPEGGRASVAEVYGQIIADLQDAIEVLPPNWPEPGRVDQGAAKFLLGRTYLLTGDYGDAVALLEDVDQMYGYALLPDYRSIFDPGNTNNAESIFEIQYGANVTGQPHVSLIDDILPWNSRGEIVTAVVNPGGNYHPSLELINTYEEGDLRYEASIMWWEKPGNAQWPDVAHRGDSMAIIKKFLWPEHINSQGQQAGNDILFRHADALLSLAEAHWRLGNEAEAVSYLDRVRARAGLDGIDLGNVRQNPMLEGTSLASDPLGRAIFNERTVELFAEGHRMFDLLRFGDDVALQVMRNYAESRKEREVRTRGTYTIDTHEVRLPIHPAEISNSGGVIVQNPGW